MNSLVDVLPKLREYAETVHEIENTNYFGEKDPELDVLRDKSTALASELRANVDLLLEAACHVQRELIHEGNLTNGNYNALWGLIYPDAPDSWEYPAQIIRHIQSVLKEKDAEIERLKAVLKPYVELSEREKDSDREQADKILDVLESNGARDAKPQLMTAAILKRWIAAIDVPIMTDIFQTAVPNVFYATFALPLTAEHKRQMGALDLEVIYPDSPLRNRYMLKWKSPRPDEY